MRLKIAIFLPFITIVFFFLASIELAGQSIPNPIEPADTQATQIEIIYIDTLQGKKNKAGVDVKYLIGNVELKQDSTFMYADYGELTDNFMIGKGHILVQQSDSIFLFSDSIEYDGNSQLGFLYDSVVINQKKVQLFSDEIRYDFKKQIAYYNEKSVVNHDSIQIRSKIGAYHLKTKDVYFKNDVVVISNKMELRADTLKMNTATKIVTFLGPTKIWRDSSIIYCESGFYDFNKGIAEFSTNARFQKGTQKALAEKMIYNAKTKVVKLTNDAHFTDGDQYAEADLIEYHPDTKKIILKENAYFKNKTQDVKAAEIIYDGVSKTYATKGKTDVNYKNSNLKAEHIKSLPNDEGTLAYGNVMVEDFENKVKLFADSIKISDKRGKVKTIGGRPYLVKIMDKDTLFIAADTFQLEQVTLASDTHQLIIANYDVKIFSQQLSGVADSISSLSVDSMVQFFGNPIMWTDSTQFKSDSINVKLKNNAIDSVNLYSKAIIINTEDEIYYRQIKGRKIFTKFKEQEPFRMIVDGSAETVYFAQDDFGKYIGASKTDCSIMTLFFKNKTVSRIKCEGVTDGLMEPMKDVTDENFKLKNFHWDLSKRPMSLEDILIITPKNQRSKVIKPTANKPKETSATLPEEFSPKKDMKVLPRKH